MRAILWVFVGIAIIYAGVWLFKDDIRDWFFPNIVEVETYAEAQGEKIRVDWTAENQSDTITIFSNKKQLTGDFRSSGFNQFLFYYEDQLVEQFEQFKTTPSSGHHYRFIFWKKQDSVKLDLQIQGPEAPL